jgi:hypothetical protein
MLLTELLGLPALDAGGARLGMVVDVRFEVDPDSLEASLRGFLVGRRAHSVFLGYERKSETAPALIARFLRWRERGTFLVLLDDVRSVEPDGIRIHRTYTRYSPSLP